MVQTNIKSDSYMYNFFCPKQLPLTRYEYKISQKNGIIDEGIIKYIIETIKPDSFFCIEFGAGNGKDNSSARNLIENHNFGALLIEADPHLAAQLKDNYKNNSKVKPVESFITVANIEQLFKENQVPYAPDLLVIDIDGNDYHIWKKITYYQPRAVCIEFNASYSPNDFFIKEYKEDFVWNGDDNFGASIKAMVELGKEKGYELIHCTSGGDNLYFVKKELFPLFHIQDNAVETMYQIPQYGRFGRAINGKGHPASAKNTTFTQRLKYKLNYYLMSIPRKLVKGK